jgi:integrase/recombinase XerD
MRLYADYLNREYGAVDSDYVFVNLWAGPAGRPMTYPAAYDLVTRLRAATGIGFSPHWCRHTYATWLLRRGAGMETVKELMGHASVATTIDTYGNSQELHQTGEKPQVARSARCLAVFPGVCAKVA